MAQYAQIQFGYIVNIIELDNIDILNLFYKNPTDGTQYDFVIQIDQLNPVPQIGWSYLPAIYPTPQTFTPPPIVEDPQ